MLECLCVQRINLAMIVSFLVHVSSQLTHIHLFGLLPDGVAFCQCNRSPCLAISSPNVAPSLECLWFSDFETGSSIVSTLPLLEHFNDLVSFQGDLNWMISNNH